MTRRLTIDDALAFRLPAELKIRAGQLAIVEAFREWYACWNAADDQCIWELRADGKFRSTNEVDVFDDPDRSHRATFPSPQAALDAAIAAGAVIDEGDQT